MVNMGVCEKNVIDLTVTYRQLCIDVWIIPLLHAAVDQHLTASCLKKMTASRYFMICSDKG